MVAVMVTEAAAHWRWGPSCVGAESGRGVRGQDGVLSSLFEGGATAVSDGVDCKRKSGCCNDAATGGLGSDEVNVD